MAAPLLVAAAAEPALAQKTGGILKMFSPDSPASMSILEESTAFAEGPMMGVFNNLVMFDQHVKQNSRESIIPDLATGWAWSEDGTEITFPLRQDIKWHDGQPFTARDVQCTWDLLTGKSSDKLRINPRKSWYRNLERVSTNGDYESLFSWVERAPRGARWFRHALGSLYLLIEGGGRWLLDAGGVSSQHHSWTRRSHDRNCGIGLTGYGSRRHREPGGSGDAGFGVLAS
jgi:hypothetical protein